MRPPHVRLRPAAKVNLHLEVLGRRPDGYHELRTLLASVDLRDELVVAPAPEGCLTLEVSPAGSAPAGDDNLVLVAARRLWARVGRRPGARLTLTKRIPSGAGLGGGSADAAATLVALDRLWGLGLERHSLAGLGAELGADVPFFLHGGLALGVGRGDEVHPLPDVPPFPVVLVVPPVPVSTAEVYRRLQPPSTWARPDSRVSAFAAGWLPELPWPFLRNDLEPVVTAAWPEVAVALAAVAGIGGRRSAVTGSGGAVYAVLDQMSDAEQAAARLARSGWRVEVVRTLVRRAATLTFDSRSAKETR